MVEGFSILYYIVPFLLTVFQKVSVVLKRKISTSVKLKAPELPEEENLTSMESLELETDGVFENLLLNSCLVESGQYSHVTIEASIFNRVRMPGCKMENLALRDLRMDTSDLANCEFANARLKRCHFLGGRLTGTNISMARLESVHFENCRLDVSIFFQSEFLGCKFSGCDLKGADFRDSNLSGTVFKECKLDGAQFYGANLSGARFLETSLDDAVLGARELKGVKMTPVEVIDNSSTLAKLLEIEILQPRGE